jgi:hypothetical protein
MELGIVLLWGFVIGMLLHAATPLRGVVRDAWHGLAVRDARPLASAAAGPGPMVVSGVIRPLDMVGPPSGNERVVAWSAHPSFGLGAERDAREFDLTDGVHVLRIRTDRLSLVTREEKDVLGNRLRLLRPGQAAIVRGVASMEGGRLVLGAAPRAGVVVVLPHRPSLAPRVLRALLALSLVAFTALTVIIAHVGQ